MVRPRTISDEAILEAARHVFVHHGPQAPVSLIAKRLGVSHAAVLQRVGSKQKLLRQALRPTRPLILDELTQPPPKRNRRAKLQEILLGLAAYFRQVLPPLIVLRMANQPAADAPEGPKTEAASPPPPVAFRRLLAAWLEAARLGRNPEALAEGLLGAVEARCFNAHLGGPEYAPGTDEEFVAHLVDGLVGRAR